MTGKKIIKISENKTILVDDIRQDLSYYKNKLVLSEKDTLQLEKLNTKRQYEFLAVRHILFSVFGKQMELAYDKHGKPFCPAIKDTEISISHSKDRIACYVSDQPCGIDIQYFEDKILNVHSKFINESEKIFIPKDQSLLFLNIIWSAKESIFKTYGEHGISLKNNITIDPFTIDNEAFKIKGTLVIHDIKQRYNISVQLMKDKILTWSI